MLVRTESFAKWKWILQMVITTWLLKKVKNETLTVEACPGTSADLPCPSLTPLQEGDRALAAFWYKDDQVTPFYMVDARTSPSIEQGTHRQLSPLGSRARFNVSLAPALLSLDVESREDSGTYVCRVDSYRSLTRTSTVELKVLAPTPKLIIYEGQKELSDIAGPYSEGSDLELDCELTAGEEEGPLQVLWLLRGEVVDSTYEALPGGKVRNRLLLSGLERGLWMVPVTCLAAESPSADPFLQTAVQLDLFLKPAGARISPSHGSSREGSALELRCRAWGSRPAADVSWWMKSFRLGNASLLRRETPDSVVSILRLTPAAADHGSRVTCRAVNPRLPIDVVSDSVSLNVTFVPKVSLSLKTYSNRAISEGDTVALSCRVSANPPAGRVRWAFARESSAEPPPGRAPGDEGPPTLVLERLAPWHKGSYRCAAANAEGVGESNSLWLAVRHRPVCRSGQQVSYAAYWGEPLSVRCEVEAEPAAVTFHWGFANPLLRHGNVSFASRGLRSVASYTPTEDRHLGSLFCWANNSAGEQHVPCTFTVFKPVAPNPPKQCRAANRTASSLVVRCEAGYDGGAPPQRFLLSALLGSGGHGLSLASPAPLFALTGLPPGAALHLSVAAENKVGRSAPVQLEASTLVADGRGKWTWKANKNLLVSSLLILFLAISTLIAAAVFRHRSHPFLL